MKLLYTTLLLGLVFLLSQPAMSATYTYNVAPGVPGTTMTLHYAGLYGAAPTDTINVNITAEGDYDLIAYGITHVGLLTSASPALRLNYYTSVDSGAVFDPLSPLGTAVATMTPIRLPTRPGFNNLGTKLTASGVHLLPGTYQVNITTSCNTLCTYFQNYYTFVVNPSAVILSPAITTAALPDGIVGNVYSAPITYSDPTGYGVSVNVTGLPNGLALTGGLVLSQPLAITGTPTDVGVSNVTITVTDKVTQLSTSNTLPLIVHDATISFTPVLPDGTTNATYSATFVAATGGTGNFTYTQTGLPNGLRLSGTTISGTPTTAGAFPVSITATDSAGSPVTANVTVNIVDAAVACSGTNAGITAYVARNPGFIVINGGLNLLDHLWTTNLNASNTNFHGGLVNWFNTGLIVDYTGVTDPTGCILTSLTVKPGITISTITLPNGVLGNAYSAPLTVGGGVAPYNTTVSGLPSGLSFDGANITGTPSAFGMFSIIVSSIDALGFPASATLSLTIHGQPIIFTPALPSGTVGVNYSTIINASGGVGTFTYAAPSLPAGLLLSGNTISGIPVAAGATSVLFTATDAAGVSATQSVMLTINPAPANYTISDRGQGLITSIGADYFMVGSKKLIWDATTKISLNTPTGVKTTINNFVSVGMKIRWRGLLDTATGSVLSKSLTIN